MVKTKKVNTNIHLCIDNTNNLERRYNVTNNFKCNVTGNG